MTRRNSEPTVEQSEDRKKRRRVIAKFTLAGVALVGIGAAATSAAWTDQAWFTGTASAATVELEGSLKTDTGYTNADVVGDAVVIPTSVFDELNQGANESVTLYLKNTGSVPITLSTAAPTLTGTIFAGSDPATVTVTSPSSTTLAAGASTSFTVQIQTSSNWNSSYQGSTGSITITYTGQS